MKLLNMFYFLANKVKLNQKIRQIKFSWLKFFKNPNNLGHICGMWDTKLYGANLNRAYYDESTKFPRNFDPLSHNMQKL